MYEVFYSAWTAFATSPLFGITLSISTYLVGCILNSKINSPLTGKLLVSLVLCSLFLWATKIPYGVYNRGGTFISLFLAPATTALAVSMYRQLDTLKKNIIPIAAGTIVGVLVSIGSILIMCRLYGFDRAVTVALVPKSVTMTIALDIVEKNGGITAVTVAAIVITGNLGAMMARSLIKLFRVKNRMAAGFGIGSCSHVTGTSKALEIGETEGAASGLAIGCAGVCTVVVCAILTALGVY